MRHKNKMEVVDKNSTIPIRILEVNELNNAIEGQRLSGCIKIKI